jgi:uncharacterized membrane protein
LEAIVEHILPRQNRRAFNELRWIYGLGGAALLIWGSKRRSLLGLALSSVGADLLGWSFTGHYLHETLGVTKLSSKGARALMPHQLGIRVERSVAVYRPIEEVYQFFRNFRNLARFLAHVKDVREIDDKHSRWFVRGPAGTELEWDAEIINDQPNELISWRTLGCADVESAGSVRFERAPGERGTMVRVSLNYLPPAGALGAAVAKLLGEEPETQIKEDLRRLKQILEAGEVATTEGQPTGAGYFRRTERRESEAAKERTDVSSPLAHEKTRAAVSGTTD